VSNRIPTASRLIVGARDNGHCVRCGGKGNEWHHRRRRGVRDEHTHAACNGVTLCSVCHAWCHANPTAAREKGWIVSAHDNPHQAPVWTFLYQWVLLNHDGTLHLVGECDACGQIDFLSSGLCLDCLRQEVCCPSPQAAAASLCGCGGGASAEIRELIERAREREPEW
jgi:hypothetical protein